MTRRLSPADLADILRDTTHAQTKPPRTTAGDILVQVLKALAAGVGAAMLVGGALWLLAAPPEVLGNAAATTGVIVAGAVLLVQAVPSDKLLTVRRMAPRPQPNRVVRVERTPARVLSGPSSLSRESAQETDDRIAQYAAWMLNTGNAISDEEIEEWEWDDPGTWD